ncbi:MAG: META domain-containing protein [Aureispira sp.]|nr:META domain-containing protein [Aureispira sp.]
MMYKILFALTLLVGIFSCKHADQDKFTNTHWVVTTINDSTVSTNVGLYFESTSKMSFSQSANSCGGNYSLSGDQLYIELEFCTEMCCDDELSGKVDDILSPNTSLQYKIKEKELLLQGSTGKLVLELQ